MVMSVRATPCRLQSNPHLLQEMPIFRRPSHNFVGLEGTLVTVDGFLCHAGALLNRAQIKPTRGMTWLKILCMRHGSDGVVIQIQSRHSTSCNTPSACVLCADGFEMWLQQSQSIFRITVFDACSCLFDKRINVNCGFGSGLGSSAGSGSGSGVTSCMTSC